MTSWVDWKTPGIYVLSADHGLYKVGRANSLSHRLDSYLLCYPRGFSLSVGVLWGPYAFSGYS